MEEGYTTVRGPGDSELIDRKSRFLGCCAHVTTEQEALGVLEEQKRRHRTANHHVYAYRLRSGGLMRYSDDGEPQGTAGLPVLGVLTSGDITDTVLVVTRYFGGTLLGTGGLVRAYGGTAAAALHNAGVAVMVLCARYSISIAYTDYERVNRYLSESGAALESVEYTDTVTLIVRVTQAMSAVLESDIVEITRGSSRAEFLSTEYAETGGRGGRQP